MADTRARGTIPRFVELPYPDDLLFKAAKAVDDEIEMYWETLVDEENPEQEKMTFEEKLNEEDDEAKAYVNFCFRTSQNILKAITEDIECGDKVRVENQ